MHVTNEDGLNFERLFTACNCWLISRLGELRLRVERFIVNLEFEWMNDDCLLT